MKKFRFASRFLAASLLSSVALAQEPNAREPELARRIDAYVRPLADAGQLSGTLLVAREGTIVYEQSFGMANYELGVPNTPATRFCVASVTKPMTAIVADHLITQGKLSPEDKLAKWIPDFPRGGEITIDHLLRHRSGIPHRVVADAEQTVPRTAADMVELAKGKDLLFAPGSERRYSSAGYSVLARVLELAGGKPFDRLLEEIVFAPAGAVHSSTPQERLLLPGRAQSYFSGGRQPVQAVLKDLSFLVGAGSVFSTPRDLLAIQQALLSGKYGERSRSSLPKEGALTWDGLTNGYRAFADHHPARKLSVIFTGNLFTGAPEMLREDIPKLAAGESLTPRVPKAEPFAIKASLRQRYEGVYQTGPGVLDELRFADPEGTLVFIGEWVLIPTSETTFFSPQDYATVKVVAGKDGAVEALEWGTSEEPPRFPRVRK